MIAMRSWQELKSFAAVGGTERACVENVNGVGTFGIGEDMHVVPCALPIAFILIDASPGGPGVVRPVYPAFLCLDDCINTIRIGARYGNADASQLAIRQAMSFELFPCQSPVEGLVQAAARTAAVEVPGL